MASISSMWEEDEFCTNSTFKFNNGISKSRKTPNIIQEITANKMEEDKQKLECPICLEPFNLSKNSPRVLPCGHTLRKKCVLLLPSAIRKFLHRIRPVLIPFFVSCPWCSRLSPRLFYRRKLSYPPKNFFVLWMMDSQNCCNSQDQSENGDDDYERHVIFSFLPGLLTFMRSFPKKFPSCAKENPEFLFVSLFLLMVLCALSAHAIILILYILAALCVWSVLMVFSELCFPDFV